MKKTHSGQMMAFSESFVCLMLMILTFLQSSKVVAPPISIYEAETFLEKFGYLREEGSDSSLMSMRSTRDAVLNYQKFMGLSETGELDDATLTMMTRARCGLKDKSDVILSRRKRYEHEGSRWATDWVSYRITKYPKRLKDKRLVDREIKRAFEIWRFHTPLRFYVKDYGRLDIEIRWEERYHGDGNSFDGPGWTLAHATAPKRNGFIHFDDEEEWTIDEYSGFNLFQVAAHEIGHTLGLYHSHYNNSLMFPNYNETEGPAINLGADDVEGINNLYGNLQAHNMCNQINWVYPSIDAATVTEDGKMYMFHGSYYWEFVKGEDTIARPADGFPRKISDDWDGLLSEKTVHQNRQRSYLRGPLDAALTWPNGQTFFFVGHKYWSFRNKVMDPGYPKNITEGFEGIPINIDAAFMWNNRTFFFKGSHFWEYDRLKTPPVSPEYPQSIRNLGLPTSIVDIEAAMQFDQRTYLFTSGDMFYRLNSDTFSFTITLQPSGNIGTMKKEWFKCYDEHSIFG